MNQKTMQDRVILSLKHFEGEWVTAADISKHMGKSTARTVGLLLKYLVVEYPGIEVKSTSSAFKYRYTGAAKV